jgi:hypothetical protein
MRVLLRGTPQFFELTDLICTHLFVSEVWENDFDNVGEHCPIFFDHFVLFEELNIFGLQFFVFGNQSD